LTDERFQKTVQRKIYLYITEFETRRFIHVLDKIIEILNITKHAFLKASPFSVETDKELQYKTMLLHSQKYENVRKHKQRFNIGDVVRISLKKSTFHRSYNLQRSYERFIVNSINLKMKFPRYSLRDENVDEISGDFLGFELVKVDLERYRAIIVKSRYKNGKKQFLHKFKGYGPEFDLWLSIDESDPKYF
jgi:hypothetical protein